MGNWRTPTCSRRAASIEWFALRYSSMASMTFSFSSRWLAYLARSCSIWGKLCACKWDTR